MIFFFLTTNPDDMEIKDELFVNGINWAAADYIEYHTIGAYQTRDSNTPGYYIFNGQVMHIPYRNNIHVMNLILQL